MNRTKFISTAALFQYSTPEGEEIAGITDRDDFCFDLNEVCAFNRGTHDGTTCIRMKNGFEINVCIPYDNFSQLIYDHFGF